MSELYTKFYTDFDSRPQIRVCVVEDEPITAHFISHLIERLGYKISGVLNSGEDAVDAVKETKPDIILMDVTLNGMTDGIDASTRIQSFSDVPIIFITAATDDSTIQRIIRTHSYGYIRKPVNQYDLLYNIENSLFKYDLHKRLLESEERFRTVFFTSPDPAVIARLSDGKIIEVNQIFLEQTGFDESEILNQSALDIGLWVEREDCSELLNFLKKEGFCNNFRARFRLKNGSVRTGLMSCKVMSIYNEDHIICITKDIQEMISAEDAFVENEKRLRLMLNTTSDGVWDYNITSKNLYVSPEFWKKIGYPPQEVDLYNSMALSFIHSEDLPVLCEELNRHINGKRDHFESIFRVMNRSGNWNWISAKGHFYSRGMEDEAIIILGTCTDITPQKEAEEEIRRLNHELEERVRERTFELQDTNRSLQKSLQTLREAQQQLIQSEKMASLGGLVAGIAHEINTPIGIGVTAASFLEDKTTSMRAKLNDNNLLKSELLSYFESAIDASTAILTNLKRAAELVNSFKQVAVDQVNEEKRNFKLREYIFEVLQSLEPKFKRTEHDIQIDCDSSIEIFSYPGVFFQLLSNLLLNSLLHAYNAGDRGKIKIKASLDDALLLEYSDDGKGMNREHSSKIFEPFFTTKRGQGGTGLGMHIVYNLVTQTLEGSISCESEINGGTKFVIKIPSDKLQKDKGGPVQGDARGRSGKRKKND